MLIHVTRSSDSDSGKKTSSDISTKILKVVIKEATPVITSLFNRGLQNGTFPHELKLAEVIPARKKNSTTETENYRPICLLPTISKVFETTKNIHERHAR